MKGEDEGVCIRTGCAFGVCVHVYHFYQVDQNWQKWHFNGTGTVFCAIKPELEQHSLPFMVQILGKKSTVVLVNATCKISSVDTHHQSIYQPIKSMKLFA